MIAVIADDFTGAAEIAGLGWRHGLRADLLARGEPPTGADLVVYDADSRNCSPAEARRRVAGILKRLDSHCGGSSIRSSPSPPSSGGEGWGEEVRFVETVGQPLSPALSPLLRHGARESRKHRIETPMIAPAWIFKKVDSVLRGNVTAEIEAALAALRLKRCLLAPANPTAGRIIRGGRYFIQGTPIHRTDFRNDPRHPRRSDRVVDLLGRPRKAPLAILRAGAKSLRDGINAGEVQTFADVQHWAALADARTLAVGGADFFRALLLKHGHFVRRDGETARRRIGGTTRRLPDSPIRRLAVSPTLFVCGSLAESSRKFLAECRAKGWPTLLMPDEMLAAGSQGRTAQARWARQIIQALRRHAKVVTGIGRPLLAGKRTPQRLGGILADTMAQVLSVARPGRLCVEGGATAALLLERMGWRRMSVEVEYATGVTGARPHRCPELLLVCKPGSYAWPAALVD